MRTAEVDYYKVLGVGSAATAVEIKQKYRELSKKYHPDTKGGDAKRMMQLNEAYGVLSNPLKRREYQPPSTKPKAAPRQTSTNGYYTPQAQPAYRTSVKRQTRPVAHEEPANTWYAIFAYILAVPVAILIVTFAFPLFEHVLPKINSIPTAEPQAPTTSNTTAPIQQVVPNNTANETPAPDVQTTTPTDTNTLTQSDTTAPTTNSTNQQTKPRSTIYYQFRHSGN